MKTYQEMMTYPTFEERFEFLRLNGRVGSDTFGFDRYLNQVLYRSPEWRRVRDRVILRDNGCDLGHPDYPIGGRVIIHHMNPLTVEDIEERNPIIFDENMLVCVSHNTHNAIHYGDSNLLPKPPIERRPNDTCPWKPQV